jgi:hypothetical protein
MRNKTKTVSILLSVAIMFATVFAIISVTYSWFNKITDVNIATINMSTTATDGLLLSGNGLDWSTTLTTDGSIASININDSTSITSISTAGTVINGNMQFYRGEFINNNFNTALLTEPSLYYVFDFYVQNSVTIPKKLVLSKNSTVTDGNNKDVELSVRVAFLNLGHSNNVMDAIALDGTGISNIDYIWEPNSTTRNQKLNLYQSNYVSEGKVGYKGVNVAASNLTLTNNLVVDALGTPEQEVVSVQTYDPIDGGDKNDVTLLMPDAITKLRVYIWSEGQDIDSTNSTSGGTANANFSFSSYNVQESGQTYVPTEKFDAPTITNTTAANYTWNATSINGSMETYSNEYLVKISKYVSSELIPIRTVLTSATSINIDSLADLEEGSYYIQVRAYSDIYASSNYSNSLNFNVLPSPDNVLLSDPTFSWDAVSNAASYTIRVYDDSTETTYTIITTLLSLNLATIFDGDVTLPSGRQYEVCVKANGTLGYVNSAYSQALDWLY